MYKYSTEKLKDESTNAMQLITLPRIATGLKPYLFARAETNGPKEQKIIFKTRKLDLLTYLD